MPVSTFDDAKSRVLQATNIVALIGQSVALKQRGKEFLGLCPFHQEKTPSFSVNPAKQRFYCHGCKKGGSAIDFVMLRDRVEFKDALRSLAEAAGIELPSHGNSKAAAGERQILFDAHSAASMFFEKLLSHPRGDAARNYLAQRGFTAESIQQFHIGLAADAWDELLKSPAMKKFAPAQLALAGLAKSRERGGGYYDTFRNRIIFPIRDEGGRVIAFGGRIMPGSDDPAKYLNSPETPLFSKSRCVFGLDAARTRIVETRTAAVVEGYTDVVMAHQFGVTNVVSVLGTALTEHHVALLRRFADRIVLLFDADSAGESAVNRAVEVYLTQPVEIAIASLPQGMDPDEFLLKEGPEAFNAILAQATDALTYKWRQLVQQVKGSDALTSQHQAVQQYLETLAGGGSGPVDPLRWGAALVQVSRLTQIPVGDLNRRFKVRPAPSIRRPVQVADGTEPNINAPAPPPDARLRAERFILGLLLLEPGRWGKVQQMISPTDFTDDVLQKIAERFWRHQQDEGEPILNEFLAFLEDPALASAAVRCSEEASTAESDSALAGSLGYLADQKRLEEQRKLIAELRRTTQLSPGEGNDMAADLDTLRKLQENARKPDLKRVCILSHLQPLASDA